MGWPTLDTSPTLYGKAHQNVTIQEESFTPTPTGDQILYTSEKAFKKFCDESAAMIMHERTKFIDKYRKFHNNKVPDHTLLAFYDESLKNVQYAKKMYSNMYLTAENAQGEIETDRNLLIGVVKATCALVKFPDNMDIKKDYDKIHTDVKHAASNSNKAKCGDWLCLGISMAIVAVSAATIALSIATAGLGFVAGAAAVTGAVGLGFFAMAARSRLAAERVNGLAQHMDNVEAHVGEIIKTKASMNNYRPF